MSCKITGSLSGIVKQQKMVISMLLAHLVGDYVFQWDTLAQWKSREFKGVVAHGLIVLVTTALLALPFPPYWWAGVIFIGLSHLVIDSLQFFLRPRIAPLFRFGIDQALHLAVILAALIAGGYLDSSDIVGGIISSAAETPMLTVLLAYAFLTMPAWVLLKFLLYGVLKRQPPDFPAAPGKYVGIIERLIVTTLIVFGQVFLVPLVLLPRLLREWPKLATGNRDSIYVAESLSSIFLAVAVGVTLRLLPL